MVKLYHSALARRLGRNLAHFRKRAGLTQEQLAEAMRLEVTTVSRYETGATLPSLVTLAAVAALLRVPVADLLAEEKPAPGEDGERALALLAPLPPEDRRAALDALAALAACLRKRANGKQRTKNERTKNARANGKRSPT
jgi:transcriptional regulator with XRE-family HTH domain